MDTDLKSIEQLLRVAVAVEVDVVKWVPVPGQEFVHPQRSRAVRRSDNDIAEMLGNQFEAAEDEGPHQDLAQLRVGLDEREQFLASELDHVAWLGDPQACDRGPPANHVAFAGELPRLTLDDEPFPGFARADRFDFAGHHHKERERFVTDFDEHFATRGRPVASVRFNPSHLPRCERWKETIETRDGCGKRHTISCIHCYPPRRRVSNPESLCAGSHMMVRRSTRSGGRAS